MMIDFGGAQQRLVAGQLERFVRGPERGVTCLICLDFCLWKWTIQALHVKGRSSRRSPANLPIRARWFDSGSGLAEADGCGSEGLESDPVGNESDRASPPVSGGFVFLDHGPRFFRVLSSSSPAPAGRVAASGIPPPRRSSGCDGGSGLESTAAVIARALRPVRVLHLHPHRDARLRTLHVLHAISANDSAAALIRTS